MSDKVQCENCGVELEEDEVFEGPEGQVLCYDCYLEEEDLFDFLPIFGED